MNCLRFLTPLHSVVASSAAGQMLVSLNKARLFAVGISFDEDFRIADDLIAHLEGSLGARHRYIDQASHDLAIEPFYDTRIYLLNPIPSQMDVKKGWRVEGGPLDTPPIQTSRPRLNCGTSILATPRGRTRSALARSKAAASTL